MFLSWWVLWPCQFETYLQHMITPVQESTRKSVQIQLFQLNWSEWIGLDYNYYTCMVTRLPHFFCGNNFPVLTPRVVRCQWQEPYRVTIDKLRPQSAAPTLNSAALVTQRKLQDAVWSLMTVCAAPTGNIWTLVKPESQLIWPTTTENANKICMSSHSQLGFLSLWCQKRSALGSTEQQNLRVFSKNRHLNSSHTLTYLSSSL